MLARMPGLLGDEMGNKGYGLMDVIEHDAGVCAVKGPESEDEASDDKACAEGEKELHDMGLFYPGCEGEPFIFH